MENSQVQTSNLENADVRVDIPAEIRRIYRVSRHLRGDGNGQVYDPMVLSLGPYHHGKPQFDQMERFKEQQLKLFISESVTNDATKDRDFFHGQIMEMKDKIRESYEKIEYGDEVLANIILRDACFLLRYMELGSHMFFKTCDDYGMPTATLMDCDVLMLENQMPLWIIKRLVYLRFGEEEVDEIVYKFILAKCHENSHQQTRPPWKDDSGREQPLHLLEAFRTTWLQHDACNDETTTKPKPHFLTGISQCKKIWTTWRRNKISDESMRCISVENALERLNLPCRSVTYLQSKGIYFRPSSRCPRDITFTSYHFHGMLHLPVGFIGCITKVFCSNIIAFEMSPKNLTDHETMSYVNFMKSLIETPKDVKVLRERGIFYSNLGSDEEVVKMFKEIQTYGFGNYDTYANVKMAINKHCNSKAKTWIADLVHSYCRSPWAAIALFAATLVLCLTFLQAFYAIHPTAKI